MLMTNPLHHISLRQRIHQKNQAYPSKKRFLRLLDYWIFILGPISSLAVLPQVIQIWSEENAGSVSLLTWGVFALWSLTMLIYGIAHKATPIIAAYLVGTFLNFAVVVGIIIY